jgi:C4-dicarboxylate transporter DctM subunit
MTLIPLVEMALRPLLGRGVENAPVLVQHLGLLLAMFGALAAERDGHLTTLGSSLANARHPWLKQAAGVLCNGGAALVCGHAGAGQLALRGQRDGGGQRTGLRHPGVVGAGPMPLGFALLGLRLGAAARGPSVAGAAAGWPCRHGRRLAGPAPFDGTPFRWPGSAGLLLMLLAGAPIFAVLGGLALALFWSEGLPLASVALSHYQITVNPSLPALPLFTLAGLVFARTGAAQRLGTLFTACSAAACMRHGAGHGGLCSASSPPSPAAAASPSWPWAACCCRCCACRLPEQRGIGLVTSASALGVLLAPSVPLIMYAIIARVPITDMFLAGLLPALVMVACLLVVGGYPAPARGSLHASASAPDRVRHRRPAAGPGRRLGRQVGAWPRWWPSAR